MFIISFPIKYKAFSFTVIFYMQKINVDINRSLNILRKYIKNSSPKEEIKMDNGREQLSIKKRVVC